MLFEPGVFVLALDEPPRARLEALRSIGFRPRVLRSTQALLAAAASRTPSAFVPVVLAPAVHHGDHCARVLRAGLPGAGIVVLACGATDDERLGWMLAGADWVCPPDEPPERLPDVLIALWKRQLAHVPGGGRPAYQGWVLHEYAWALQAPDGTRLSLTAGERAILMVLFHAPGHTMRYGDLGAALAAAYGHAPGGGGSPSRLAVVINRLRTKGRRAGVDVPVHAVRGHGYALGLRSRSR